MSTKQKETLLLLFVLVSISSCTSGQLHILCSATGDCIHASSPLDATLSSLGEPNAQHNLHINSHSIDVRKADVPTEENLSKESQKLQNEIGVVQDVETAMKNEIEKLDKQQPSKAVRTGERELKKELSIMKDIESDLVSEDAAIEEEVDAIESTDIETDEDSYAGYDEDYSEETDQEDNETSNYDYEYPDSDYTESDSDDYRERRGADHFRPRKPHHKKTFRADYVKHEPKQVHTRVAQESALDQETAKISEELNRAEKLSDETQKLQEEVSVVQDIESVMEDELKSLKKHHPSKVTNAEVKELKNELTVMNGLESELVTKEKATEQELEEVENEIETEPDHSDGTNGEEEEYQYDDYDLDESDYADIDDYSYEEGQSMAEDRKKRSLHFKPHTSRVTHHSIVGVIELHPLVRKHLKFYKSEVLKGRRPNIFNIPGLVFGKHLVKQHQKKKPPQHKKAGGSTVKNLEKEMLQVVKKTKATRFAAQREARLKAQIRRLLAKEKKRVQVLENSGSKKSLHEIHKKKILIRKLQQMLMKLNTKAPHKKGRRSVESSAEESRRLRRSDDISRNQELAAEEQRIKNEINVVQNVENDMEEELKELNKQRPSKLVHSEKETLQHELDTLNQVESDLASKEGAIENKLREQDTDTDEDYDDSYENDDETEMSDYEEEDYEESDSMAEYEVDDYSYDNDDYDDEEEMHRPKRNALARMHARNYFIGLCKKKLNARTTKFWINFCKKYAKKKSKKPSHKAQAAQPGKVSKKNRHQKHHPTDQATKAAHKKIKKIKKIKKNKHHNRKPHLITPKVTEAPKLTYSGGKNERCQRCEQKVGEEVCGSNGKTYNSLCHAINCAGLSEDDVNAGPCSLKDVCSKNVCAEDQLCVPMTNGVCLATYQKGIRSEKLPCRRYLCVTRDRECTSTEFSQVCGVNGKSYPSLCFLHKAGVQMAYTGVCRPDLCRGVVCGEDGTTYKSSCHARAHNVRIDYSGECFAEKLDIDLTSCSDVRKAGRCVAAPCRNSVIPAGACCPVCGGAAVIQPDYGALSSLAKNWEEVNHLYIIENFLRKLLTSAAVKKCELTSTLTDSGNISIVLAAVNPEEHKTCNDGVTQLVKTINKHPASLENSMIGPVAKTAAMINPFNPGASFQGYLSDMQNKAIKKGKDSINVANHKYKSTLKDLDNKATRLEDQRELERENGGKRVSLQLSILTLALLLVALL